jgi:hypothetical protein
MAHEEAVSNQHSAVSQEALSSQHSAISEDQNLSQNQNQNQNQKRFTAKDAEDAEESKQNQQRRSTTEDTEATEGGKTLPLIHGKTGQVNADEQARVQQRAEALALKLAQTYEELTRLLERNPGMKRQFTEGEAKEDRVYQRLKQRLKMADMAPRCQWVRQDGTTCGSPQLKQHIYCFAHRQMAEARTLMLMLPAMEDANAIQIGIMRIQKALIEGTISTKMAGLLLYSMQLALQNVGQTTFGQAKDEEMVRETVDEDQALSDQQSAFSEKQNQHQRAFTTEGTEDTEEKKNLPRMDADERGLKNPNPIVWKPTPDMYRMDTPEGREAYEASFRMKIKPRVAGEPRPLQGIAQPEAAVPHEHAQTHANLG